MEAESLNSDDVTQLIHYFYRFKDQIPKLTIYEFEKTLAVLERKFNRYPILCCNLWLPVSGTHLPSCINKELTYKK